MSQRLCFLIFIPLADNSGVPIEDEVVFGIRDELFNRFGGLTWIRYTDFPLYPIRGFWLNTQGKMVEDEISIFLVVSEKTPETKNYFGLKKHIWKGILRQDDLFILVIPIEVI